MQGFPITVFYKLAPPKLFTEQFSNKLELVELLDNDLINLAKADHHNVFIDNSLDNYNTNVTSLQSHFQYSWLHIKNVNNESKGVVVEDNNFMYLNSLPDITNLQQFSHLSLNTNYHSVKRDSKCNLPELIYWQNTKEIIPNVTVSNTKIIHGKKVGRTIGIPTGWFISKSRSFSFNTL